MRLGTQLFVLGLVTLGARADAQPASADRVARLVARGDAQRAYGDSISAVRTYRDAIAAGPRRGEGYVALGALYRALDEPSRAREVYEAARRAQVHSEPLVLAYADTLARMDAPLDALRVLRDQVRAEPDALASLEALAALAEARGAYVEALAARRGALAVRTRQGEVELAEPRTRVRALERLLGPAERVRAQLQCADPATSDVLRALARCP
ncbi:MAG: hypothetical protein ABW252_19710 [Polyangiales bacterium]